MTVYVVTQRMSAQSAVDKLTVFYDSIEPYIHHLVWFGGPTVSSGEDRELFTGKLKERG